MQSVQPFSLGVAEQVILKIPDMSQRNNMSLRVFVHYFPLIFPPANLISYPYRSLSPVSAALQSSQPPYRLNKEEILRKVHCLLSMKKQKKTSGQRPSRRLSLASV